MAIELSPEQREQVFHEFIRDQQKEIETMMQPDFNGVPMWSYNKKAERKMNKYMLKAIKKVIAYNSLGSVHDDVDLRKKVAEFEVRSYGD